MSANKQISVPFANVYISAGIVSEFLVSISLPRSVQRGARKAGTFMSVKNASLLSATDSRFRVPSTNKNDHPPTGFVK